MDERDGTIAELRSEIEEMQARAAALEANLGEQVEALAAHNFPYTVSATPLLHAVQLHFQAAKSSLIHLQICDLPLCFG